MASNREAVYCNSGVTLFYYNTEEQDLQERNSDRKLTRSTETQTDVSEPCILMDSTQTQTDLPEPCLLMDLRQTQTEGTGQKHASGKKGELLEPDNYDMEDEPDNLDMDDIRNSTESGSGRVNVERSPELVDNLNSGQEMNSEDNNSGKGNTFCTQEKCDEIKLDDLLDESCKAMATHEQEGASAVSKQSEDRSGESCQEMATREQEGDSAMSKQLEDILDESCQDMATREQGGDSAMAKQSEDKLDESCQEMATQEPGGASAVSKDCATNSKSHRSEADEPRDIYRCSVATASADVNKPFKCIHCSKQFKSIYFLTAHERMHTNQKLRKKKMGESVGENVRHPPNRGEKTLKCEQCEKYFRYSCELERHIRSHTGEKPFKCKECAMCFSQINHLVSHIRVHTGEKPFKCEKCEKSFSLSSNLSRHLRVHSDVETD